MLEIHLERLGPPSVVAKCVRVGDIGAPAAWEAVVKVEAFPINPADLAMLSGRYGILPKPPCGIGMEAAGTILRCGDSVTDLQEGDRVIIIANDNWAQYRKVPANLLHKIPPSIDCVTAATMKVNMATAYLLLTHFAKWKKGSWIIQNAPLSNVGRMVIQVAKALGLRTVNLVRRENAIQEVLDLGGDVALLPGEGLTDAVRSQLGRAKINLALDAVGGDATETLADCCADKATIVTYGMLSGESCRIRPEQMIFKQMQLRGFWLSKILNRFTHDERSKLYDDLVELVQGHPIQPRIDQAFTIENISEAIQQAEQGAGKIVVFPHGPPENSPLARELMQKDPAQPTPTEETNDNGGAMVAP